MQGIGVQVARSEYVTVIGQNDLGNDVTVTEHSDWGAHV